MVWKIFNVERGVIYAILIALVLTGLYFKLGTKAVAYEFSATLKETKENSLVAQGSFLLADQSPEAKAKLKTSEVMVGPSTKITRVALFIPKTNKMFKVDDLRKEEREVNFDTLKKDFQTERGPIGLTVKANKNIFNKSKFEAVEVIYKVPVY